MSREVSDFSNLNGHLAAETGGQPDPEVVPKAERRKYSAAYKLRILAEADACARPGERPRCLLDRLLLELSLLALRRMDRIVAVSHATGRSLTERLGIGHERIRVVYEGTDHDEFRPRPDARLLLQERNQIAFSSSAHYVLFVGNEFPRKNLRTL
jgi:glycosyltransferase involved in cell wall biosynthesis